VRKPFSFPGYLALLGVAAAVIALAQWRENRSFFEPAHLLSRFPAADGTALSIDFKALRAAGLLNAPKTPPEPEYKQFLDGTGVDYRRDLDLVVASFSRSGNYFIARGRFDWNRLRNYAARQGGSCYQQLCRLQGSTPERHISFLPLRYDTLALAVGADDLAAARLTQTGPPVSSHIPTAPVWLSVPGAVLRQRNSLPSGLHLLLSSLVRADRVVITAAQEGSGIEARLDASCHTASDASTLASQLRSTTGMLRQAVLTNKEASQDALALALAAGTFDSAGARVTGKWPLAKNLIESLTAGI
jgi:hypothetical protein